MVFGCDLLRIRRILSIRAEEKVGHKQSQVSLGIAYDQNFGYKRAVMYKRHKLIPNKLCLAIREVIKAIVPYYS